MYNPVPLNYCRKFQPLLIITAIFAALTALPGCGSTQLPPATPTPAQATVQTDTAETQKIEPVDENEGEEAEPPAKDKTSAPTPTATKPPASTPTATATSAPTQTATAEPTAENTEPAATTEAPATPKESTPVTATPASQTEASGDLLPAPVPLAPEDGMVFSDLFDGTQIFLQWSEVKPEPRPDELYLITIQYNYQDQVFTDYAWTQQTSWPVNDHSYLAFLSDDNLFKWSVTLINQTETNSDGVPAGPALSQNSVEQSFIWQGSLAEDSPVDNGEDGDGDDDSDFGNEDGGGGYP